MPTIQADVAGSTLPVPPLNLAGNFHRVREEVLAEIAAICDSGYYVLGPKVAEFEAALATYCGSRFALGLSSGTDALLVAMMALEIGPGDEVIVPTFTFFASAGTVARLGARPVFVDVEPDTFNIDVSQVESRITPRTKAIMPVHLYGQLANLMPLMEISRRRGVPIIEDAAQAIGARPDERTAAALGVAGKSGGAIGLCGALSFYPTKNLGAIGDAGALLTDDERLFELTKKLRIHGSGHTYYHERIGGNFRIDALQAAILRIKLAHLEQWTEARRARAARYTALIEQAGLAPEFVRPPREARGRHVYHQYVIRAARRDDLAKFLTARKIGCGVYYPLPLHEQTCFANLGYKPDEFPHARKAAAEVLALPIYPELTDIQQEAVVSAIRAFYRSN
ncbi:MAG: DegT/DnrJ/EryC1/StrS family aminotransferase [Phycisphaerae bacterium]